MRHEPEWWEERLNLVAVLDWAFEMYEMCDIKQAIHFLEKPWLYEDLWLTMRDSLVD